MNCTPAAASLPATAPPHKARFTPPPCFPGPSAARPACAPCRPGAPPTSATLPQTTARCAKTAPPSANSTTRSWSPSVVSNAPCCCRRPSPRPSANHKMALVAFHFDRSFVLDALRQGEIDYLEHVSEAPEGALFVNLTGRQRRQPPAATLPHAGQKRGSAGLDLSGQRTQP